jgi:hypothetical protein
LAECLVCNQEVIGSNPIDSIKISMGQLDVYSLEDISIITLLAGPLSTYITEETEESIESIVPYIYSANILIKKRVKLLNKFIASGDIVGSMNFTWNILNLYTLNFIPILKTLDDKLIWQDPVLSQWEGAADRKNLARLFNKYNW